MAKRGRRGWKKELELKNLAKLCESTLYKALRSKKVSKEKKIDIAKAILPRFIPKDVNFTASGKIEHQKITLITSDIDADIVDLDSQDTEKEAKEGKLPQNEQKNG